MTKAIGRRVRLALIFMSAALVTIGFAPAIPATAATADQCVVHVTGVDKNDNFILSPMQCFATYADVLRSQGGAVVSDGVTPKTVTPAILQDDAILGTHYDGTGFTGPSFSVEGTLCSGGGLNLPLAWNDRISSTANGCNDIVHYQNTNYGGSTYTTTGSGGDILGIMNNQTSSIKYFA